MQVHCVAAKKKGCWRVYLTGLNFTLADMWEYNPSNDSWTQIPDYPVAKQDGKSFIVDGVAFAGGGSFDSGASAAAVDLYKLVFIPPQLPCSLPPPKVIPPAVCVVGKWVLNDSISVTTILDLQNTTILIVGNMSLNGVLKVDGNSVINIGGCLQFDGVLEIDVSTLNTSQPFVPVVFGCIVNYSIQIVLTGQKQCEEIAVHNNFVKPTSIVLVFDITDGCTGGEDEDGSGWKLGTGLLAGIIVGGMVLLCCVVEVVVLCWRRVRVSTIVESSEF